MVLPTVAGREEVIERALKNLKDNFNIELTEEEINELYSITAKYIKKTLKKEDWCTVQLNNLGKAYYKQTTCREKKVSNISQEAKDIWASRDKQIEDYFQDNQRKVNRKKCFRVQHVIQSFISKNKRRGWDMFDIEESQNSDY